MTKLAYTPAQAAESLGVSRGFFDEHIKPQLNVVYVSARILIPVTSLNEWLNEQSVRAA